MFNNLLKKRLGNEKGLTLIELLAVIVILAIIAAIAIPAIGSIIDNSRGKAQVADAINILDAANLYFTDNPNDTDNTVKGTELLSAGYVETLGKIDTVTVIKPKDAPINITFKDTNGTTHKNKTLDNLSDATVKKGVISIPTTP
ncbi:prepilin-type N-terminal cleavage/methylation domain-containing protein [Lysinibacillus composti]|uniref:Prepilin-type N-terminal cleavage/methylation domain-containing protein n=2 Tax=Lysinibacillus composti TaxID=720633 RepID=A0A3N9UEB8_9BACI|nr:prepilin-type N-terminal cleavage/methylation domain-containing protein [Lysinibacillus composti]RQW74535.1 prepilin-type N-terminal cleavage/methylation domain-containing protein [Lysinibacillus composti]